MKLAILSCSPSAYSNRRLKEAAVQQGHKARVLNTLKFAIDLDRGRRRPVVQGLDNELVDSTSELAGRVDA